MLLGGRGGRELKHPTSRVVCFALMEEKALVDTQTIESIPKEPNQSTEALEVACFSPGMESTDRPTNRPKTRLGAKQIRSPVGVVLASILG